MRVSATILICLFISQHGLAAGDVTPLVLKGHGDARRVRFSPDGKLLASSGMDGIVRVWESVNGKELAQLPHGKTYHPDLAFSVDGKKLGTFGRFADEKVRIWDIASRKPLREFEQERIYIGADNAGVGLAFSPDGKIIAVGALRSEAVILRDAMTAERLSEVKTTEPFSWINTFAISPDGKTLAISYTATNGGSVVLWSLADLKKPARVLPNETKRGAIPEELAFSADGKSTIEFTPKFLRQWDVQTERLLVSYETAGPIMAAGVSKKGKVLALQNQSYGEFAIWDAGAGTKLSTFTCGKHRRVYAAAFSPDCELFATAMADGAVLLWDLKDLK